MKIALKLALIPIALLLSAWTFQKQSGASHVKVERYGRTEELAVGSELKKYDTLYVGKDTKILLTEGDSQMWVGENTVLRVDLLKADNSDTIKLESGKIRVQIKPEQAARWKFETRSAVSGVRGTEFFIASSEATESVCVLEGTVASELSSDSSRKFTVPAGKGVQIREGQPAVMVDNSNFLVNQWVAETSLDEDTGYIPATYATNTHVHELREGLSSSVEGNFFMCDLFNPDFDRSTNDVEKYCFRGHLYPSLIGNTAVPFRLTPRLSFVNTNFDVLFDAVPATIDRQQSTLTVSEAYLNPRWQDWDWKLGFQKLNVADGLLLSEAQFTNEPLTQLGINSTGKIEDHELRVFLSQGLEGRRPLDGFFPHSLALLDLKLFESRGDFYVLRMDSIDPKENLRPEIHETNVGFLFNDRSEKWDYKISGIYQSGSFKNNFSSPLVSVSDRFFDLQTGFYAHSQLRIFARYLDAGLNYSSVAPAAYALGLFPNFYQIGNLRQGRAGLEYRIDGNKHFTYEYIASADQQKNGIVKWRPLGTENSFLSEESDFIFKHKWDDYISYQAGAYWFVPHGISAGTDPAYGAQAWLIFSI